MTAYPGISSDAFRHPADREAEDTLRSFPGFQPIAQKFVEFFYERPQHLYLSGRGIQVGPQQYHKLYQRFQGCCHDLDIQPEPLLFLSRNAIADSYALGQEKPCIVLNASVVDVLDDAELSVLLAHELGHVKCNHSVLTQMAIWATGAVSFLGDLSLGLGNLISTSLMYNFYEWRRQAELSADRAALLVVDDFSTVARTIAKLAGGCQRFERDFNLDVLLQQAETQHAFKQDSMNDAYKFFLYNNTREAMLGHPFPIDRLYHLNVWQLSDDYRQIRDGNYLRDRSRAAKTSSPSPEDLRRQVQSLKQQIEQLKQPQNEGD